MRSSASSAKDRLIREASRFGQTLPVNNMASQKAWAVVAGVGPGTGASVARTFAKSYAVALLARKPENYEPLVKEIKDAGGYAVGISTDASDNKSVISAFDQLKTEFKDKPLVAAVYNVGGQFIRKPFLELTEQDMEAGWATNGRGAANFARQVIPLLQQAVEANPEYPPSLIFTSATAAMKGSAQCASFATGKFAMRALAQSLAREFGPQGIHVVHAIIDGVIDIERTKHYNIAHPEGKIAPQAIADTYWYLHTQPRTCFTNEIDIRPAVEKW